MNKQETKIIRTAIKLMKKNYGKPCPEFNFYCWGCRATRTIEEFESLFEEGLDDEKENKKLFKKYYKKKKNK